MYYIGDVIMNAKVVDLSEDTIAKVGTIIEFTKEKPNIKEMESVEIKSLRHIDDRNLFFTYFASIIKRVIDICAGIVGIIVLIPLTIIILIANKILKEDGPVFYTQDRIGKNGKIYKMIKYRTMIVGADEKLQEYLRDNKDAKIEYQTYKKLKVDPRVTKIGEILRKTSLDEMPQLLHLLTRRNVFGRTKTLFT